MERPAFSYPTLRTNSLPNTSRQSSTIMPSLLCESSLLFVILRPGFDQKEEETRTEKLGTILLRIHNSPFFSTSLQEHQGSIAPDLSSTYICAELGSPGPLRVAQDLRGNLHLRRHWSDSGQECHTCHPLLDLQSERKLIKSKAPQLPLTFLSHACANYFVLSGSAMSHTRLASSTLQDKKTTIDYARSPTHKPMSFSFVSQ